MQHFVKAEDASAALNALDDSEFLGSHIQVQVKLGVSCILSPPRICVWQLPEMLDYQLYMCVCSWVLRCTFCDLFTSFPIVVHQFARTKGHGYGRGSGPPRPRFAGRGLVTPTHSISSPRTSSHSISTPHCYVIRQTSANQRHLWLFVRERVA